MALIQKHLFQRIPADPNQWLMIGTEQQSRDPVSIEIKNLTGATCVAYTGLRYLKNGKYGVLIDLGFKEKDMCLFSENRDEKGWVIINDKNKILDFLRKVFCKLMFALLPSFENENWDCVGIRIYDDVSIIGNIFVYGGEFRQQDFEGAAIEEHSDLMPLIRNEHSHLDELFDCLRHPPDIEFVAIINVQN